MNQWRFVAPLLALAVFSFCVCSGKPLLAQQGIDPEVIQKAKAEGQVVFYVTWNISDTQDALNGFQKRYPFIKTASYRAGDAALMNRVRTEAKTGLFAWDVLDNTTLNGDLLTREGYFARYLGPERKFVLKGHMDDEGYWVSSHSNINVLIYSTRLVSPADVPKTHQDLLDPRWKGKIAMERNAYEWFANVIEVIGESKGVEFMKRLGQQQISFRSGRTLITQLIAAGEVSMGISLYLHRAYDFKKRGAPIDWVMLEPAVANLHPLGLSARAPHPNAGKLLISYLMSKEFQSDYSKVGKLPGRADVPVSEELLRGVTPYPSNIKIAQRYNHYVKLYRELLQAP